MTNGIFDTDGKNVFKKPETWDKMFWGENSGLRKMIFPQQGYEEKGCGHIEQIIANVDELLFAYFENLYYLNFNTSVPNFPKKEQYILKLVNVFKPNLILF